MKVFESNIRLGLVTLQIVFSYIISNNLFPTQNQKSKETNYKSQWKDRPSNDYQYVLWQII